MSLSADNLFSRIPNYIHRRCFRMMDRMREKKYQKKILIIESDDWGSIRTSSADALKILQKEGYDFSSAVYSYDALETEEDLELLFDVLGRHGDKLGRHPSFVANYCVANPDFKAIKESGFRRYSYEPVSRTWLNAVGSKNCRELVLAGRKREFFYPELHGREHVHVRKWMNALIQGNRSAIQTFDLEMCGLEFRVIRDFDSCFYSEHMNHILSIEDRSNMIDDAISIFQSVFGNKPESYIAPNYVWDFDTEKILKRNGIDVIQAAKVSRIDTAKHLNRYLHVGARNAIGQKYSIRNCFFEPASLKYPELAACKCIREIDLSFDRHVPAVVCSHRLNYSGRIKPELRDRNLKALDEVLSETCKRHPDVEFLSPQEYYELL